MNQIPDDGRAEDKNPAFSGVMIKCKNKVLLCKRREDVPDTALPKYWSVPCGYVEVDEEIKAAATTRDGAEITIYMRIFPIEKTGQKRTGAFIRLANQPEQKPVLQLD